MPEISEKSESEAKAIMKAATKEEVQRWLGENLTAFDAGDTLNSVLNEMRGKYKYRSPAEIQKAIENLTDEESEAVKEWLKGEFGEDYSYIQDFMEGALGMTVEFEVC